MRRFSHIIIALFILATLTGCSFTNTDDLAPGRYAVQWKSYIGAMEGETINPSFSFIDVHPQRNAEEKPQINQLQLLTDRGTFPADIGSVNPSSPHVNYQVFTILADVRDLPAGLYTFDTIEYIDEAQQTRTVLVGEWTIEILPEKPSTDLHSVNSTIGGTRLGYLDATLFNTQPISVSIEGIRFALPSLSVTTTMTFEEIDEVPASAPASTVPTPVNEPGALDLQLRIPQKPVEQVTIDPAQKKKLIFDLHVANQQNPEQFIILQPLLEYRMVGDSQLRHFTMPRQLYSPPFDEKVLSEYVRQLPATAYHPFGS